MNVAGTPFRQHIPSETASPRQSNATRADPTPHAEVNIDSSIIQPHELASEAATTSTCRDLQLEIYEAHLETVRAYHQHLQASKTQVSNAQSIRAFVSPDEIRTRFVKMLSEMFGKEIALYKKVLAYVEEINERAIGEKVATEHHGAIRVGNPKELHWIARIFRVMDMYPVNYYNLTEAGLPVHSTAFRPITKGSLEQNAFRMFVSLLIPEAMSTEIPEESLRAAMNALQGRNVFPDELRAMVVRCEQQGGLTEQQTEKFLALVVEVFKHHRVANISLPIYNDMKKDKLPADMAASRTLELNHLTPEVMNTVVNGRIVGEEGIDELKRKLKSEGIRTIHVVQGPPARKVPILLRQVSVTAVEEDVAFPNPNGGVDKGKIQTRFVEFESKHAAALTPKGRALYDKLLAEVRRTTDETQSDYNEVLKAKFQEFPDDLHQLWKEGLIYVEYQPTQKGLAHQGRLNGMSMADLVEQEFVKFTWVDYHDFLPISAAGIFKSNLQDGANPNVMDTKDRRQTLEQALPYTLYESSDLYEAIEVQSVQKTMRALGIVGRAKL